MNFQVTLCHCAHTHICPESRCYHDEIYNHPIQPLSITCILSHTPGGYISFLILVFVHIPVPEHQNMISIYAQNQAPPNPLDANITIICTPSSPVPPSPSVGFGPPAGAPPPQGGPLGGGPTTPQGPMGGLWGEKGTVCAL